MRTVHIVPSFHYDVAYLDTYEGYLPRALDNLLCMLELLRSQPEYTFVVEQVVLLEALVTRHADLLPELRALAERGRLEIACGMYVMPDMTMPSGESLIRQAVTGQRWLQSRLGVQARTCWIADCWGHPPTLPGLLRHCGYRNYIFWRGKQPWLTSSEFYWRGLDGGTLLCHWTPFGYGAVRFPDEAPVANAPDQALVPLDRLHAVVGAAAAFAPTPHVFLGNSGDFARPQASTAPGIAALNRDGGELRFVCSTPARFFSAVAAAGEELPTYDGEFNPVFQGTYSSRIALKQLNRRLESALASAERANVLFWLDGGDYPAAQLAEAWRAALVNQFHDIIAGTIVDAAYTEAVAQYRAADGLVTRLLMDAVDRAMARRVGHHGGMGIFTFNPLPRPRTDVLRLNTMAIGWSSYRVQDAEGRDLPVQVGERELLVEAQLPPLGYAVLALRTGETSPPPPTAWDAPDPTVIRGVGRPTQWGGKAGGMVGGGRRSQGGMVTVASGTAVARSSPSPTGPDATLGAGLSVASSPVGGEGVERRIETDHFRARLRGGVMTSLVDTASGREYVDPARPYWNDLVLQNDSGDLWLIDEAPLNGNVRTVTPRHDPYPAPATPEDRVNTAGITTHGAEVSSELVEDGPLRTTVRARGNLRFWTLGVEFVQFVTFYRRLRRIDFRTELTGRGKRYRVRVAFPTPFRHGRIVHSVPCGQVERPEGEYPAQGWIGYGDDEAIVYLCNRGLPGANVTDGVLMLSLLRSVAMEYKGPSSQAYEEGVRHTFSYRVVPADAAHPVEPWWEAEALNCPPLAIVSADVRPHLEPRLHLEPANVMLSALYRDGDVLTVRLYEATGIACDAQLWLAGLSGCRETDALSFEGQAVPVQDETAHLRLGPFQIKTLRLEVRRQAHG